MQQIITKQIKDSQFQAYDIMLAEMEMAEKPSYDILVLKTETTEYRYKTIQQPNNFWYYVTD